jgi:hypothetical protein
MVEALTPLALASPELGWVCTLLRGSAAEQARIPEISVERCRCAGSELRTPETPRNTGLACREAIFASSRFASPVAPVIALG